MTAEGTASPEGEPDGTARHGVPLSPGTPVEVRSGFDGSWQRGFVVEEVTDAGYRLRRSSDDDVLPELPHEQVRRERRRQTWWI